MTHVTLAQAARPSIIILFRMFTSLVTLQHWLSIIMGRMWIWIAGSDVFRAALPSSYPGWCCLLWTNRRFSYHKMQGATHGYGSGRICTSELTSACQHTSVCISTHQHTLKQTRTYYYTGGRQYVTVHIITMSHALPDGLDRFQAPAIIIQRVSRFAFLPGKAARRCSSSSGMSRRF